VLATSDIRSRKRPTDNDYPSVLARKHETVCWLRGTSVRKTRRFLRTTGEAQETLRKCFTCLPYCQKWERFYSHGNDFIHMGTQLLKFYNQLTEAQPSTPPSPTSPGSSADPRYIPAQLPRGTQTTAME